MLAHRLIMIDPAPASNPIEDTRHFHFVAWRGQFEIDWPSISASAYPNVRSAVLFQLTTSPSNPTLMIASSEDSTIAANER